MLPSPRLMRLGFSLRCRLATILPVALAVTVVFAHSEQIKDIHPTGYVTDLADVLSAESKSRLEVLATELQQKTDVQLAVVTVNSLEGQSVDDYAVDLYKHLGVGFKGTDRGVLILVAPKDRKYRVEVGYGLEPVINDARAGDVGRAMVPLLRRGDYDGAIEAAAWQLAQYVAADRGVTLSGQRPERHLAQHQEQEPSVKVFTIILVALFLLFLMNAFRNRGSGNRRMGPRGGGWWIGPMMGGGRGWGGGGFGGGGGGFSGGGGFGGFGGGSSGGGGASGSW